jgi:hypothetical protein
MGDVQRSRRGDRSRVNARDRYVRELAARLPFALGLRARVLAEVREHLREGGDEAFARFGPVEQLVSELSRELRLRAAARASWLVPTLIVAFVFPFYVVPENTLPPAPWDTKPDYLAWKQSVAGIAFLAAAGFAAVALVLGRVKPRLVFVPLIGSLAALAVTVVFASVVAVQWIDAVPGTSAAIMYAGVAGSVGLLLLAGLVVGAALPQRGGELATD